ncbi:MAG: hypothetical protein V3T83_06420, partial [Acidobacteriota bacterium]
MTIPINLVDQHFWKASTLFNANAFPPHVKSDARKCGDRFAILTHSVDLVLQEPGLERRRLLEEIRTHPGFVGFDPGLDKTAIVVFHNLYFVSGVYSALMAVKSLLDLYAQLIARLLVPGASVQFNKGTYKKEDRRRYSGGKFLNWIEE